MLSSFQVCIQSRDYIFKHKNEWKPRRKWAAENTTCSNVIYLDLPKVGCTINQWDQRDLMAWGMLHLADVLRTIWFSLSIVYCSTDLFVKAQGSVSYIIKPENIFLRHAEKVLWEKAWEIVNEKRAQGQKPTTQQRSVCPTQDPPNPCNVQTRIWRENKKGAFSLMTVEAMTFSDWRYMMMQ